MDSQAFIESCWRRSFSEVSLLRTTSGSPGIERYRRVGKGRGGAQACGNEWWGRARVIMLEENQERIQRHDLEVGGGGRVGSHEED